MRQASLTKTVRYLKTNKNVVSSKSMPGSLQELKSTAKDAIRNVKENMLTAVIANFCKCVNAYIQETEGHIEFVMDSI